MFNITVAKGPKGYCDGCDHQKPIIVIKAKANSLMFVCSDCVEKLIKELEGGIINEKK